MSHDLTRGDPGTGSPRLTQFAMAVAALMMAFQIAGKAARDAVFLSQFPATTLPRMIITAALVSITAGIINTRILSRASPARIVPGSLVVSGVFLTAEFLLMPLHPRVLAVVVYLHIMAFGPIMLSSFWSLVAEMFDPRSAKRSIGRIAGAGTVGGIAGGLLAERTAAMFSTSAVLLTLAALHLIAAGVLFCVVRRTAPESTRHTATPMPFGEALRSAPYLPLLGGMVLAGTTAAALLDYAFKAQSAATLGKGPELLRFFAAYHTAAALFSFLVQTFFSRFSLERLGLARTVATMPAFTAASAGAAAIFPGLGIVTAARGIEQVLRGSLFRAGYELFFTPVPPAQKRSLKTLIDVGFDRMGDAVGALLVQALLMLGPAARMAITAASAAVSLVGLAISTRLDRAYSRAVESGLRARAGELEIDEDADGGLDNIEDYATRSVVLTLTGQLRQPASSPIVTAASTRSADPLGRVPATDLVLRGLMALRSADRDLVQRELGRAREIDPLWVPQLIQLLGWDDVADLARVRLREAAGPATGQLLDALLSTQTEFAVRRRLPQVLARAANQRAVDGLVAALADVRFEVRFQCARAIDSNLQINDQLRVAQEAVMAAIDRELSVSRSVWDSHRLLDRRTDDTSTHFLDEVLAERANQAMEHVFSLLALILPRDPLKIAFRALHTDDGLLHALAVEYLDTNVPFDIRSKLSRMIDGPADRQGEAKRTPEEAVQALMQSNQTVLLRLEELARRGGH